MQVPYERRCSENWKGVRSLCFNTFLQRDLTPILSRTVESLGYNVQYSYDIIVKFHGVDEVLRSGTEDKLTWRWQLATGEMKNYYNNKVTWSPIGEIVLQTVVPVPFNTPVTIAQVRTAMTKFGLDFSIGMLAQKYNQAIVKKGWTSVMPKLYVTDGVAPQSYVLPPPFGSP